MAKDYWGNGTGSLTPRDDAGAGKPVPSIPEMPRAATAQSRAAREGARPQAREARPAQAAVTTETRRPRDRFDAPEEGRETGLRGLTLPDMLQTISFARKAWFGLSFLAPVILGGLYLFLIAPNQYITEYRFSVRVPVGQQGSMASGGATLSALFGGNPTPGTDLLDNFTVADYVTSAQAAADLDGKVNLRTMFNKPFDPFSRVGAKPSSEQLAKYWRSMIYSSYDVATGLAVVKVTAYTPQDSYAIATNLINLSSDLVNSIGNHSQQDSVRFAQQQFDRASADVAKLQTELVDLRRSTNVIDPDHDAIAGNVALLNGLMNRRSQLQTQLTATMAQLHNAGSPQVVLLKQQLAATDQQITDARKSGGMVAGAPNVAVTVGRFEDVEAKLKQAQSVQAAAVSALSNIKSSADSQRLYLTTYVKPSLPESPQGPNRWLSLMLITLVSAMVWLVGRLVGNSIMEHA